MWEGMDDPLPEGNWPLVAASALPYRPGVSALPRALARADLEALRSDFAAAAVRAADAGFDLLELHCAHGYLLSGFLSPLTNHRDDEYGGCLENRLRFPLEVFDAVREVWPGDRPMTVRLSATDWAPGGTSPRKRYGSRPPSPPAVRTPSTSRRVRSSRTRPPSTGARTRPRTPTGSGARSASPSSPSEPSPPGTT